MIRIGNRRFGDEGVYVGRPTILGNPFAIGPDGDRERVIALYRRWFSDAVAHRPAVRAAVERLVALARKGDLTLVCWCMPETPCHAEVIRDYIERRLREEREREPTLPL